MTEELDHFTATTRILFGFAVVLTGPAYLANVVRDWTRPPPYASAEAFIQSPQGSTTHGMVDLNENTTVRISSGIGAAATHLVGATHTVVRYANGNSPLLVIKYTCSPDAEMRFNSSGSDASFLDFGSKKTIGCFNDANKEMTSLVVTTPNGRVSYEFSPVTLSASPAGPRASVTLTVATRTAPARLALHN